MDTRSGLEIDGLEVGYGTNQVLHRVSFSVPRGKRVALLGANGAGKSTILKTISGLLRARFGEMRFEGRDLTRLSTDAIVREGIVHVPEGRHVFPTLTVEENLRMAGYRRDGQVIREGLFKVFDAFPILAERRRQPAGLLSGGQQQMLALGRAIVARPRLLLLDEMSLGLAPVLVKSIYASLDSLFPSGTTMLVVEQNARMAIDHCEQVYVLRSGSIVLSGPSARYATDLAPLHRAYLGLEEGPEEASRLEGDQ